jgi:hypothetical protein
MVGGTDVHPTVELITTYPNSLVGLVKKIGKIVSALTPEPFIVVTPRTFTVSAISQLIKYPGMVETIKIESEKYPEQISGFTGFTFTDAVGLITSSCIIESTPQAFAVYIHM